MKLIYHIPEMRPLFHIPDKNDGNEIKQVSSVLKVEQEITCKLKIQNWESFFCSCVVCAPPAVMWCYFVHTSHSDLHRGI